MRAWRIHKTRIYLALAVWLGICLTACEREPSVAANTDASTIEERYGLTGAYSDRVNTGNETVDATIVPITLSDGRTAQLVIPRKQMEGHRVFLRDADGMSPVVLDNARMTRDEFVRSQPRVVQRQTVTPAKKKRSWQKEALIIGGGSAAGAAIGAVAGGGKGAGVGAISGGVAGLIYDMATKNKK
jgi:hypothetical protein